MLAELNCFKSREPLFESRYAARAARARDLRPRNDARPDGCAYSSSAHTYRLFRLLKIAGTRPAKTRGLLLRESAGAEKGDYRGAQKDCQVDDILRGLRAPKGPCSGLKCKEKLRRLARRLAVPEFGRALFEKGRHAFLLVFGRKKRVEHAPLK